MGSRIVDITVSTLITIFAIYVMKWLFVKQGFEVPILTAALKEVA